MAHFLPSLRCQRTFAPQQQDHAHKNFLGRPAWTSSSGGACRAAVVACSVKEPSREATALRRARRAAKRTEINIDDLFAVENGTETDKAGPEQAAQHTNDPAAAAAAASTDGNPDTGSTSRPPTPSALKSSVKAMRTSARSRRRKSSSLSDGDTPASSSSSSRPPSGAGAAQRPGAEVKEYEPPTLNSLQVWSTAARPEPVERGRSQQQSAGADGAQRAAIQEIAARKVAERKASRQERLGLKAEGGGAAPPQPQQQQQPQRAEEDWSGALEEQLPASSLHRPTEPVVRRSSKLFGTLQPPKVVPDSAGWAWGGSQARSAPTADSRAADTSNPGALVGGSDSSNLVVGSTRRRRHERTGAKIAAFTEAAGAA